MSEVELFLEVRHQVKSFAGYIGESLAKNYRKGLNGSYRNRLEKGVQVAVRAKSGALVEVINKLLKDREQKGARTVVDIPKSELAMRALVLGLWSSRPVYIGRQDKVQLGSNQVYGDKFYDPPIDLSGTGSNNRGVEKEEKLVKIADGEKSIGNEVNGFDLGRINDERNKIKRLINERRGQPEFRKALK